MDLPTSTDREAFTYFLRTGRRLFRKSGGIEMKFNPYHDPRNGQFTFAPGGPKSRSAAIARNRPQTVSLTAGARRDVAPKAGKPPLPYLSSTHNEIRSLASKYPPALGTNEWTLDDLAAWKVGGKDSHDFKAQWVHGYRDAINAAADRFNLPRELVAGVAYNEVGGDPVVMDGVAYSLRAGAKRDRTSFGDLSVQVRSASASLGYDPSRDVSEMQRRMIIASLKQPQTGIFIAAKHLSDLRNVDYSGIGASRLTKGQIEVIGARYNQGAAPAKSQIQKDLSYGRAITKRWGVLGELIR